MSMEILGNTLHYETDLINKIPEIEHTDHQDAQPVSTLCNKDLCNLVSQVGYVGRTIIQELDKYTEVAGKYPCPLSVCIG